MTLTSRVFVATLAVKADVDALSLPSHPSVGGIVETRLAIISREQPGEYVMVVPSVGDDATIDAYVASGESFGKAGGYAIQGGAEVFVTRLDGSYSGVMGHPLHETARLLAGFGLGSLATGAA